MLWSLLAALPALKSWHVAVTDPALSDGLRQVGLGALALAGLVVVVGPGERWYRAVLAAGVWPDLEQAGDPDLAGLRWALAIGTTAAAVLAASTAVDSAARIVVTSAAGALLVALVVAEVVRYRRWRRDPMRSRAVHPVPLWSGGPLAVAGITTAIVLAARTESSSLDGGTLAELGFVTAFGEELIFRGCLLAIAYRVVRPRFAHVVVALSFGAWHIGDALAGSHGDGAGQRAAQVVATVVVTFVGGVLLTYVRQRGRLLLAPTLAHMAANLPGLAV